MKHTQKSARGGVGAGRLLLAGLALALGMSGPVLAQSTSSITRVSSFEYDERGLLIKEVNRTGFEVTPKSWTNLKGLHEEVRNRVQAHDYRRP